MHFSIDGFRAMIDKVVELTTDEAKRVTLQEQAESITRRYAFVLPIVLSDKSVHFFA